MALNNNIEVCFFDAKSDIYFKLNDSVIPLTNVQSYFPHAIGLSYEINNNNFNIFGIALELNPHVHMYKVFYKKGMYSILFTVDYRYIIKLIKLTFN